jgi:hypothetical protein
VLCPSQLLFFAFYIYLYAEPADSVAFGDFSFVVVPNRCAKLVADRDFLNEINALFDEARKVSESESVAQNLCYISGFLKGLLFLISRCGALLVGTKKPWGGKRGVIAAHPRRGINDSPQVSSTIPRLL